MGQDSKIQWTDATWNIARGCSKVDEDCKFCYMYRDSFDGTRYNPREVIRTKSVFNFPLKYKETKSKAWDGRPLIFTSSLTDVFHEAIDPYRNEMWDIIRQCPHLIFQILTKRPERVINHLPADWGDGWDNVWLGTSCGSQASMQRATSLLMVKAKVRFLSLEPLHGSIDITECQLPDQYGRWPNEFYCDVLTTDDDDHFYSKHAKIDWVIIGGESGHDAGKYRYRPCELDWIERIVRHCKAANTPVFVKQMGTSLSKQLGMSDRHGGDIAEFPTGLQIRQFPIP